MTFGLEDLLIAMIFLLPGFLSSHLISAKTPAVSRAISPFEETLQSLLRSVVIHFLIAPVAIVSVYFVSLKADVVLIDRIYREGIQAYYLVRPFEVTVVLFLWLLVSFLLALIFGYIWDPISVRGYFLPVTQRC
jgi:hypothetical protein